MPSWRGRFDDELTRCFSLPQKRAAADDGGLGFNRNSIQNTARI